MSRLDSAIAEISAMRVRSDSDILVTDGIAGGATQITGFRRVSLRAIMATASSHGFDAGIPIAHGGPFFCLRGLFVALGLGRRCAAVPSG